MLGLLSALLVVSIYLTTPDFFGGMDWVRIHSFYKDYLGSSIRAGRLPLWNPDIALGRPFLADADAALFYPLHWLYILLPVPVAAVAILIGHTALALYGSLKFAGVLGLPRPMGWAMGLVFLASAPIVGSFCSGLVHYGGLLCYLPLTLYLATRLSAERSRANLAADVALMGVIFGLQWLGGHPQAVWLIALASGLFLLGRRCGRPVAPSAILAAKDLAALAGAVAIGLLLASVSLWPLFELAGQSNRHVASLDFSGAFAMPAFGWATFLVPTDKGFTFLANAQLYSGIVPFLAGVAGLLLIRQRDVRGFLAMALFGGLLAAGPATPLFPVFFRLVPGVSLFRIPSRASVLLVYALLGMAAIFLSTRPRSARGLGVVAGMGALSVGALIVLLYGSHLPIADAGRIAPPIVLVALSTGLVLAWLRTGERRRGWIAGLLVLVTAADLGLAIVGQKAQYRDEQPRSAEPLAARWVQGQAHGSGVAPPRVSLPKPYALENAGMAHGYSSFTGYASMQLGRVWHYLHARLGLPVPLLQNTYPDGAIFRRGPFPYDSMSLALGLDPVSRVPVQRRHPDPRVYVTLAARELPGYVEATAAMAAGHDFHRIALVEPGTGLSLPADPVDGAPIPSARLDGFWPERIELRTETDRPGLAILAEAWYPGWRAEVNGAPAPCLPVNAWMRGVPVPAGKSRIVLTYTSRFLLPGALVSLFAALLLGVFFLRRRRR